MITYLEVNKFKALDNESVGEALQQLDPLKKDNILLYDMYYQKMGYLCTGIFTVNSTVSSIVIYTNYLDSKTVTVFLTNLLFMSLKVLDVYNTVNSKPNIFFSAYLKKKVQYNDVDPDKYMNKPTEEKTSPLTIQIPVNVDEDFIIETEPQVETKKPEDSV